MKIFILLYADDTVLFSSNPNDLQKCLDTFKHYCTTWRLTVNVAKTKILIISQGRPSANLHFYYDSYELEIVKEYKYLGIYISRSGSFNTAKQHISEQANKALFSMIKKCRDLNLPVDLQIDLFDKTIKPILLYGCEIWGFGNCASIERIQLKFYKYLFNLKRSTPSFMIYSELGIKPIILDIKTRVLTYWCKLLPNDDLYEKLSSRVYTILYLMHSNRQIKSSYIQNVKNILDTCGFSGIWLSQDTINPRWFKAAISQRIKDQYLQDWSATLNTSSSTQNYRLFKDCPQSSNYLKLLSNYYCKIFIAFRTRNHRLPVERGRWNGTALRDRMCFLCNKDVGDEFHYLLSCTHFRTIRIKYINRYYYDHPNTLKFKQLMNSENPVELRKLCLFIKCINEAMP